MMWLQTVLVAQSVVSHFDGCTDIDGADHVTKSHKKVAKSGVKTLRCVSH